jgi:hypothetical protein
MMPLHMEDPDPGLNSDPEQAESVTKNYESGSSIRSGCRLEVFQMAKTTSELLRSSTGKGEGAREKHTGQRCTDRQKEN